MRIVVLQGSPNRDGSTAMLTEEFARGARQAGHEVVRIDVAHEDVAPCAGCDHRQEQSAAFDTVSCGVGGLRRRRARRQRRDPARHGALERESEHHCEKDAGKRGRHEHHCKTDVFAGCRRSGDLVYAAPDGASLVERMESRNGAHTLEHAEAIGLGSQTYRLIDLDV